MEERSRKRPTYDFSGKSALVTGGAAGIGRVIALAFGRQGASVIVADINLAGAEETIRRIEAMGGTGVFTPGRRHERGGREKPRGLRGRALRHIGFCL